jgi:hypothetical protein
LVYNIGSPRIIEDQLPAYLGGSSSNGLIWIYLLSLVKVCRTIKRDESLVGQKHQKVLKWKQERLTCEIKTLVELSGQNWSDRFGHWHRPTASWFENRSDRFGKPVKPVLSDRLTASFVCSGYLYPWAPLWGATGSPHS